MQYAVLGRTGLHVSRICLGTMTFGSPLSEAECRSLVGHALDCGVNFFDTANVYEGYGRTFGSSGGVGESMLGKALSGRRGEAVICTKLGNPVGHTPLDAGLSARHLDRELEKSLHRLGTDWIDLVLIHRWEQSLDEEEVWRTCDRWVRAGKVLHVGVSNWPVWRIARASELARRIGWAPVVVSSPQYNLLTRGAELEHFACARHYGIAIVPYQPFQGGVLTGKYRRGTVPPEGTRAAEKPGWLPPLTDALFDRLEQLERLASEAQAPLSEYVLSWTLSRGPVASVILGCRSAAQLDAATRAVNRRFPAEHAERVDALFPPPKPFGGEQVLAWRDGMWKLENQEA